MQTKQKEFHFQVKIPLTSSVEGMLNDMNLVEELIDQINQFSRMYWKSAEPLAIEKVKTK